MGNYQAKLKIYATSHNIYYVNFYIRIDIAYNYSCMYIYLIIII